MRLRITDRILVGIAGLLLLCLCGGMIAQMFFGVDLAGLAVKVFSSEEAGIRWALMGLALALLLLGGYCLLVLFRHRKRKDKFILQKNDNGELAISIKALENMVNKCLEQHDEIQVQKIGLENRKEGLLIRIAGSVAGGVSIPLTVEAIQKQIRQYVTACSGVEVKGIRVQIDSSGPDAEGSPFVIAAPAAKPLLKEPEEKPAPPAEEPAPAPLAVAEIPTAAPVAAPVENKPETPAAPAVVPPSAEEEDDRPLHQRLFSTQAEPCLMPEAPAELPVEGAAPAQMADEETPAREEILLQTEADSQEEAPVSSEAEEAPFQAAEPSTDAKADQAEPREDKALAADPDFLEGLRAFDQFTTGGKEA